LHYESPARFTHKRDRAFSFIARHNVLSTQLRRDANKTVRPRIAGGTELAPVIRALAIYGSVAAIDRPLVFQFRNPSSRFNRRPTTMRSSSGTHAPVYLDCKRAPNVRFGSKADICSAKRHVRFTPKADMCSALGDVRFGPKAARHKT